MKFKIVLIFLLGFFFMGSLKAQGSFCSDIEPFCAGDQRLTFPNSNDMNSSQVNGEIGPDYGCLLEQPYPAWFFLQIEESGNLTFKISQYRNEDGSGEALDVDFVVWGPFQRNDDYCNSSQLNAGKIVDCSYLPDAVETMNIPGAQANEIYVVVITNFETEPGFISLEQTNSGQGSTDCSILDLNLGDEITVCDADEYVLDGSASEAELFEWYIYNEATGQYEIIPGENEPTLTVTQSGDYRLVVTDLLENKSEEDEVTVTFYDSPLIGQTESLSICDAEAEFIDLTRVSAELIAPNGNSANYAVQYFETFEDIENETPVSNPENFPFEDGASVFARIIDNDTGCFSEIQELNLGTFDFPDYSLPENFIVCVDNLGELVNEVNIGSDLGTGFTYEWSAGGSILSIEPVLNLREFPSDNQVRLRIVHAESGCELNFSTMLQAVSSPETVTVSVSGSDFGDGYTVTANAEGVTGETYAEFEYRLDNGNWSRNNVFVKVPPGSHRVSVRETNGCGEATSEAFFLVGYPRFFTPNSDGYNDTWNVISDSNITIKKLLVFDRYGKLIRELNTVNSKGWDGTYNGKPLPADDYWFRVGFIDEKTGEYKEYMSNFTLMR